MLCFLVVAMLHFLLTRHSKRDTAGSKTEIACEMASQAILTLDGPFTYFYRKCFSTKKIQKPLKHPVLPPRS